VVGRGCGENESLLNAEFAKEAAKVAEHSWLDSSADLAAFSAASCVEIARSTKGLVLGSM
jgi:hypothetical protein